MPGTAESEVDMEPVRQVLKAAYSLKQSPAEHVNVVSVLEQSVGLIERMTETARSKLQPKTAYDQNLEMLIESLVNQQLRMSQDMNAMEAALQDGGALLEPL